MIEHLELFAGAGGSALGFYNSGLTSSILAVDNDLDALNTLTSNRSHFQTRDKGELFPLRHDLLANPDKPVIDAPVWLLSGGFPCQPFSVASGKYRNQAILDLRGITCMVTHVAACKPKIVFMENVPGFRDADNGNAYRWLLSSLRSLGYVVSSSVVNMAHYGIPQHRKRLIILAWSSTEIPPLVSASQRLLPLGVEVTLREALKDVPPSIGAKITPKTAEIYSRVTPGTVLNVAGDNQRYRRLSWDEPCTTITTTQSGQSSVCHPSELRRLTVREVARVMTFPDSYTFQGTMSAQYRQLGNAVPPLFTEQLGRMIVSRLNRATMGEILGG
jgi:DNA (cytosine-5)-methyltransferase 1